MKRANPQGNKDFAPFRMKMRPMIRNSRTKRCEISKIQVTMSKQKKQTSNEDISLEEYSEYDDPKIRREIRSCYRGLIDETQKNKDELIKPESTGLTSVLAEAEGLFRKVRHTREAVLDSSLLLSVTNLGSEQATNLQTDFVTFDPMVFADKLIDFMTPNRFQINNAKECDDEEELRMQKLAAVDWSSFGKKCCKYFKRSPTVDFMLGPLVIEVRPRKERMISKKEQNSLDANQKVAPQELLKAEEQEEATTKEVERVYGILKQATNRGSQPVGFFEFVTDPTSFGKTIENIFHLSFLVKDGKASIDIDDDGQPVVCASNPYCEQDYQEIIQRKQIVMPLSFNDWKEIVEVYNIKEPMIPTRTDV